MRADRGVSLWLLVLAAGCSSSKEPSSRPHDGGGRRVPDAAVTAAIGDAADDDLPAHRIVADLPTAVGELIGADVRAVGFGELHQRMDRATSARSALGRFSDEVLPAIAERTSDLVLETWLFDPKCGKKAEQATAQVEATMQRPAVTKSELATLVERARAAGVQPHAMRLSCDDWAKIAPPAGIDYEAMLAAITRELGRISAGAIAARDKEKSPRRLVVTYGGALHNDLYPIAGIEDWSFAAALDKAAGGSYVEIDLYVPEYATIDQLTQTEPWFPLLARTGPDHVVVIERGPRSFVVLLPTSPSQPR